MQRESITAYVYTYNEERNISACVRSVEWCDEVLVVDSYQTATAASGGDMLMTRAWKRGAAAVVTDGGLRDGHVLAQLPFPTYASQVTITTRAAQHQQRHLGAPLHEVLGEVAGVRSGAVDQRRLPPAQERQAHQVQPRRGGDPPVVHDAALPVEHPGLEEEGEVRAEAGRPDDGLDPAGTEPHRQRRRVRHLGRLEPLR